MSLPAVTDHALMRYLDRALGLDLEAYRREIALRCAAAVKMGASGLTVDGIRYEFRGGAVISVLGRGMVANNQPSLKPPKHRDRPRRAGRVRLDPDDE